MTSAQDYRKERKKKFSRFADTLQGLAKGMLHRRGLCPAQSATRIKKEKGHENERKVKEVVMVECAVLCFSATNLHGHIQALGKRSQTTRLFQDCFLYDFLLLEALNRLSEQGVKKRVH